MLSRRRFLRLCATTLAATAGCSLLFQSHSSIGVADRIIPILLYHRVGYTNDDLTITPNRLARDLRTLKELQYTSISLEQFEQFLFNQKIELPEKPLLITFDDGYLDNYENAFPILQKNDMLASFFIITGMLPNADRIKPAQIREMAAHGMSFGSHTVTHKALGDLTEEERRMELSYSKIALEDVLGKSVNSIAYPKGSYDENTIQIAQSYGYSEGFTVKQGLCSQISASFHLTRIPVFGFDPDIREVLDKRHIPKAVV